MDGITLAAARTELVQKIVGAKIEKIYQPEKDELLLLLRGGHRLLLSANAARGRVQLTRAGRQNPAEPPMFCMLMRKHLTGGRVLSLTQPGFDRILHIAVEAQDELGELSTFTLIMEIMGKHSNIVLIKEDGTIVDAIRHVTPAISSVRVLMPGVRYEAPPAQDKADPTEADEETIRRMLETSSAPLGRAILSLWSGLSPAAASEIACRAAGSDAACFTEFDEARRAIAAGRIAGFFDGIRRGEFYPTLVLNDYGDPVSFFPYDPMQYASQFKRSYDSISETMDVFYDLRERADRIRQKGASLHRILTNNVERCCKKLAIQQDILRQSERMEQYRLFGELLTANAYQLERGARSATVQNYYSEDLSAVTIPLDPTLSPSANAQRYYKKYNKAKAAYDMADGQIAEITEELEYLEGQLNNLENCTEENELAEIREELIREGYVRPEKGRKRPPKIAQTKPLHYLSSDGTDIFVGKNNVQNDYLTLRFADGDDIWMHTKKIPGSHVIVKSAAPSETTLREAALLAAWHSKARTSAQVPVDYTPRKYVKKPSGSKPGFVIYTTNRTLYATPDERAVKALRLV